MWIYNGSIRSISYTLNIKYTKKTFKRQYDMTSYIDFGIALVTHSLSGANEKQTAFISPSYRLSRELS